jgi:hypothetical protein
MVHDWTTDARKYVPRAMRPRSMASFAMAYEVLYDRLAKSKRNAAKKR